MLSDTEFKGEGPAPSGSRPPLGRLPLYPALTTGILVLQNAQPVFVLKPLIVGSTGPNWMKFCMELSNNYRGIFLIFGPGAQIWSTPGAKKLFSIIFIFFSTGIAFRSRSLVEDFAVSEISTHLLTKPLFNIIMIKQRVFHYFHKRFNPSKCYSCSRYPYLGP